MLELNTCDLKLVNYICCDLIAYGKRSRKALLNKAILALNSGFFKGIDRTKKLLGIYDTSK